MGLLNSFFSCGRSLWGKAAFFYLKRKNIISYLQESPAINGADLFYVGVVAAGETPQRATGVGVNMNYGFALYSAVSELLERFSLKAPASHEAMRNDFEDCVFPKFISPRIKRSLRWVRGSNLLDDAPALLPAQSVFWDYDIEKAGEPLLIEPNISGAAGALTPEKALIFGVYELIERDAFLTHWLKQITPPKVDPATIHDKEINFLLREAERTGLRTYILDITSDIPVPAYMAALIQDDAPMVSRGFSANLDSISAVKKALYEAWGNYFFNSYLLDTMSESEEVSERPLLQRYKLWMEPKVFKNFVFLMEGGMKPFLNVKPPGRELETLKNMLRTLNLESYYYTVSNPILSRLEFHVAKVIIPGLIPLYFSEKNIPREHPRLREGIMNEFPHPFA